MASKFDNLNLGITKPKNQSEIEKENLSKAWELMQEVSHSRALRVINYETHMEANGAYPGDEFVCNGLKESHERLRAVYEAFTKVLEEDGIIPKLG